MSVHIRRGRERAVAAPGTEVGATRYRLYREAYAHANRAIKAHYYLEAIAVTESLLADRLESRASFLLRSDVSFKTLEKLIEKLRTAESDAELRELVLSAVMEWKGDRNQALHEMAKLARGDGRSWQDRMASLPPIADAGLKLVRKIDRRIKVLRKMGK